MIAPRAGEGAAMRPAVSAELLNMFREGKDIVILGADGHSIANDLLSVAPGRYIDVGVAEQCMVGVAGGIARMGYSVVVSALASFLSRRANEQIRNDVCNSRQNVTFIGKGGGLSYGTMGATHQAPEDLAIFKSMPNTMVFSPADVHDAVWAVRQAVLFDGPAYVRIGSRDDPYVFGGARSFSASEGVLVRTPGEVLIVSAGRTVYESLRASDSLRQSHVTAGVLALTCIKPLPRDQILRLVRDVQAVVVVEEHVQVGGLGQDVASILAGAWAGRFHSLAIDATYPPIEDRERLLRHYEIDCQAIATAAVEAMSSPI